MSTDNHRLLTQDNGIHSAYTWIWANAAERAAETDVTIDDVDSVCKGFQLDNGTEYICTGYSPIAFTLVTLPTATQFTDLIDTPSTLGTAGQAVVVDGAGTALEFKTLPDSFIELTDVPSAYTGAGQQYVRVKTDESGLEFAASTNLNDKVKISATDLAEGYLVNKITAGSGIVINHTDPSGLAYLEISASSPDEKVKVSATDPGSDYLEDKLVGGPGVTLVTSMPSGSNEIITINAQDQYVRISSSDLIDGYLADKIFAGSHINFTHSFPSGANEIITISLSGDVTTDAELAAGLLALSGDMVSQFTLADSIVTSAFGAADLALSGDLRAQYIAADVIVTDAFIAADLALSGDMVAQFTAADSIILGTANTNILALSGDLNAQITTLANNLEVELGYYGALSGQVLLSAGPSGAPYFGTIQGGGAKPDMVFEYPAGSFDLPDTVFAPLDRDTGTNGTIYRHLFDDTTEEFVEGDFTVPSDITAGNVTITTIGYAVAAAASKNVQLKFYHSAKNNAETWDATFADKSSGDKVPSAYQDSLDIFSFTETVANLGWAAGDNVRFKLSRIVPSGTNLSGDYGVVMMKLSIPRA